jgi:hypothetical protein
VLNRGFGGQVRTEGIANGSDQEGGTSNNAYFFHDSTIFINIRVSRGGTELCER